MSLTRYGWHAASLLVLTLMVACTRTAVPPGPAGEDADLPLALLALLDEDAKLLAGDGASGDTFGYSVAVSGDTAVIAARGADGNVANSGAAYVFVRSAGTWTQQAKLAASDGAGGLFGTSVAVSGDTALIGAPIDVGNGTYSGSAYVFVRSGTSWSEQAKLFPSDGQADDIFGFSVAMSGDTAVIGAATESGDFPGPGAAYVFVRSGITWSEQAKLLASDGQVNDGFGISVAVSEDTALVGAPYDDDNGSDSGSAYAFIRSGSSWTEQAKLLPSDGATADLFGYSVAVSGDTAVIGAFGDDDNGSDSGSAYAFIRSGSSWTEQAKLLPSDGATADLFGWSVAVSGDTAVIGAHQDDDNGSDSGSAYAFIRSGSSWTEQAKLLPSDGTGADNPFAPGDAFGYSVAVSGDTALIGAYLDDDNGTSSGSAYGFDLATTEPGIFVSSTSGGRVDGVTFTMDDVLVYHPNTGTWAMFLDGSDVGLGDAYTGAATDVNAFHLFPDGTMLLSFRKAGTVPGLGLVDDSDVVRFTPTSTGDTAAGTFEMYFDGSDVGLTRDSEHIDALGVLPDGDLLLSTNGSFSLPGLSGKDEDLVRFTPNSLGSTTAGSFALFFDGSDVGITSSGEDIYGAWWDEATGELYLTTKSSFSVAGASGGKEAVFVCGTPNTLGPATACTFRTLWDGARVGFKDERLDALFIVLGATTP